MTHMNTVYHCNQCGGDWKAPSQDDAIWWEILVNQRKGFLPEFGVMTWLRENTDLGELDIKNIVCHQVRELNHCSHCNSRLNALGVVECNSCGSMNYNFEGRYPAQDGDEANSA